MRYATSIVNTLRNARRRARNYRMRRELALALDRRHTAATWALFGFALIAVLLLVPHVAHALTFGSGIAAPLLMPFMGLMAARPLIQNLDPKQGYGGEGTVAVFELPRAMLYRGIVLHGEYTDTLSVAATSAKTYGVPIERIDVVAENGNVLHTMRPTDLARVKQTHLSVPLASMLNPPTALTVGAKTGTHDIPLSFDVDRLKDGQDFMLPAWRFEQVQVLVYFTNTHANIYTGGTGVITYQVLNLAFRAVVDLPPQLAQNPNAIVRNTQLLYQSYKEKVVTAADAAFTIEVPRSADILRVYIQTEDANRDPVATVLNKVSLIENGQVRRLSSVNKDALRSMFSEDLQATLPVGWHVVDFTQPSDSHNAALEATKMNSLDLQLDVNNVANAIVRAVFVRKAP